MSRRSRNRRGRFQKGHGSTKRRKNARRRKVSRKRRSSKRRSNAHGGRRRRRRSRARSSNPPRRRRRRSRARKSNPPRRRRGRRSNAMRPRRRRVRRMSNARRHGRRRNPPSYTIKDILIDVALVGLGFVGSKGLCYAICYATGDQSWGQGAVGIGIHLAGSLTFAASGYFLTKLATGSKQKAMRVGGELLVGGLVATAHEGYRYYMAPAVPAAPMTPAKAGQAGMGVITPQQIAQAQAARNLLIKRGAGNFSPQAFQKVGTAANTFFTGDENF